jgi:hypothetical protein
MPSTLLEKYKNRNMPKKDSLVEISEKDGNKAYEEINNEMKESRREFAKKEKESHHAASEILINV